MTASKNKVQFVEGQIVLNGEVVGYMEGRREIYVTFKDSDGQRRCVARYKYMKPGVKCKAWLKFILQHYTPQQLIDILYYKKNGNETPVGLAEKLGYECPVTKKLIAENEAYKARQAALKASLSF